MATTLRLRPTRALAVPAVGGLLTIMATTGITLAATTTSGYSACSNAKHQLALLNSRGHCAAHYRKVAVGARGPAGARGHAGPPGKQGPPGQNGVTNGYVALNTASGTLSLTDLAPVVQLSLPAGKYTLSAKTVASGAAGGTVSCLLITPANGTIDSSSAAIAGSGGSGSGTATIALAGALSITSTATITLWCAGGLPPSSPASVAHSIVTATQLNNLTTTGS
jgi:hypothetical protein